MDILFAILGVVLAAVGIGVMVAQTRLAATQQKLFIKEKQYRFYEALTLFLHQLVVNGEVGDPETVKEFYRQRRLALLLFDENIAEYMDEIDRKFRFFGLERSEKRILGQRRWFAARYGKLPQTFSNYLELPKGK